VLKTFLRKQLHLVSFDPEQGVYYHDYNQITGERNYYRLNGMMPSTGASTDFIKR